MNRRKGSQAGPVIDIRQVAAQARVSPATVSRVANGTAPVSTEIAKRVWRAIEELGYTPNPQARALVSGRSRTLGLLISEITNPFFPELIESFEHIADQNDFEVLVGSTSYNRPTAPRFINRLLQRRVEGVAVMTFRDERRLLDPLIAHDIPLVSIDVSTGGERSAILRIDYARGLAQAVQHLASLGHRRFAFVGGPMQHHTNVQRRDGFHLALSSVGLSARRGWMVEGDHTPESGVRAVEHLLSSRTRPTAILCSNDLTAVGVLRGLQRRGVRTPEQISVVGFDDIRLAEFTTPSLTTIRMSRELLAETAFRALERLWKREIIAEECPSMVVETSLVLRESTLKLAPIC